MLFYIYWDSHVVFAFFFCLCGESHWFAYADPCELGMWRIIFFTCCWIWYANILLKIVASVFIKIFPCNFLIRCCLVLVILMDDDGFIESLRECFLLNFWKSLGTIDVSSSLYIWQNQSVKPSGLRLSFVGSFKIIDSISLVVIDLFKLSVCSWFNFRGLYVSRKRFVIF